DSAPAFQNTIRLWRSVTKTASGDSASASSRRDTSAATFWDMLRAAPKRASPAPPAGEPTQGLLCQRGEPAGTLQDKPRSASSGSRPPWFEIVPRIRPCGKSNSGHPVEGSAGQAGVPDSLHLQRHAVFHDRLPVGRNGDLEFERAGVLFLPF